VLVDNLSVSLCVSLIVVSWLLYVVVSLVVWCKFADFIEFLQCRFL